MAITGVLFAIALPSYQAYRDRVDVGVAIADIDSISSSLLRYWVDNGAYPASLEAINAQRTDPWGNAYYYTPIANASNRGSLRKDKNLVPINSDFDLYSAGKDGETRGPLTAKASQDDVVRANNGGFVGLAEDY